MKIIIFNGPSGCGKTEGTKITKFFYPEAIDIKTSDFLRDSLANLLGFDESEFKEFYERYKDVPLDLLSGMTLRQVMIAFSEDFIKPLLGKDFFGKILAKNLTGGLNHLAVMDAGFEEEIVPIVEVFGGESIFLIRVYRYGYDFIDDRRHIHGRQLGIPEENTRDIINDGHILEYEDSLEFLFKTEPFFKNLGEN